MICDKVEYATYDLALAAAKAINLRENEHLHPYKCHDCGLYHTATRGKRHGIRNIYKPSSITLPALSKQAAPLPKPKKIIRPTTERLLSKEMADHLKRLINGNNEMQKQKL
jgi:hypothetical protein